MASWYKHFDSFTREGAMLLVRKQFKTAGVGMYLVLKDAISASRCGRISADIDELSLLFDEPRELVESWLELVLRKNLFFKDNEELGCTELESERENRGFVKAQTKERVARHRTKTVTPCNAGSVTVTHVTECNALHSVTSISNSLSNSNSSSELVLEEVQEKPKRKAAVKAPALPVTIADVPESLRRPDVREAWDLWKQHREQIKKPLTPLSAKMTFKRYDGRPLDLIRDIEHTISNQWQGLREPDNPATPSPGRLSFKAQDLMLDELENQRLRALGEAHRQKKRTVEVEPNGTPRLETRTSEAFRPLQQNASAGPGGRILRPLERVLNCSGGASQLQLEDLRRERTAQAERVAYEDFEFESEDVG